MGDTKFRGFLEKEWLTKAREKFIVSDEPIDIVRNSLTTVLAEIEYLEDQVREKTDRLYKLDKLRDAYKSVIDKLEENGNNP